MPYVFCIGLQHRVLPPVPTPCHESLTQEPRRLHRPMRAIYVHALTLKCSYLVDAMDAQTDGFPWNMTMSVQGILFCASSAPTYLNLRSVHTEPALSLPSSTFDGYVLVVPVFATAIIHMRALCDQLIISSTIYLLCWELTSHCCERGCGLDSYSRRFMSNWTVRCCWFAQCLYFPDA